MEVDRERLARTLEQFREAERLARKDGLSFIEAMRLLASADIDVSEAGRADVEWSQVAAGPWLAKTLTRLRSPMNT